MHLDKFLKIKKSSLPGAGKGVFTTCDILKGTTVTDIRGPLLTHAEYMQLTNLQQHYSFYINRNNYIDSYSLKKQFGRYVNDANGTKDKSLKIKNNTTFVVKRVNKKYEVWIVATRNILKGEEILVDYGADYW